MKQKVSPTSREVADGIQLAQQENFKRGCQAVMVVFLVMLACAMVFIIQANMR